MLTNVEVKVWSSDHVSLGKNVKTMVIATANDIKDAEAQALAQAPECDRAKARMPLSSFLPPIMQ